jgi:hypothetical protein
MDLLQLDVRSQAAKPTEIEFHHPVTKKPLGLFWKTIGRDADEYQQHVFDRADERQEEQAALKRRNRHAATADQFTAQSLYDDQLEELVFMSRGYRDGDNDGVFFEGTEAKPYSKENAEYFLKKYPWMVEQVHAAVGNRALFMPDSATP